ncbi:MAG: LpqC, poly [Sphingomonas bacterium]|uniref:extracellular catalytic domain type 1 short-chain-length polyhydroxyalkanoate depolymerase n=1 Tax=Sphingomonas bacterium TaxID=1895847 RepID=UPI0026138562|nr:PHB depolymerase family esterase [Sphingomonas bacterium]MDB5696801.1 LpqC, poly [Sphingomonas bacterium]
MESFTASIRLQAAGSPLSSGASASALLPLVEFGSNPGALNGWCHVPDRGSDIPLVVVLHGCTQTAAGYDRGAGWSELAEQHGFALLFPEQQRANNPNLCFNWFVPGDTARDDGEALSIRQMIGAMLARHAIDSRRIFITGLSAGGAMTSVMLATYPELFAGGGIIAGLPYGAATSVTQALQRMRGQGHADADTSAALLRAASLHAGPWPTVSVWHGDADTTVAPLNADAIVDQWRTLHGAAQQPDLVELIDGHRRRVWLDGSGREAIEEYRVAAMGHGTPLSTRGDDACGTAGPHMLEAGISSTVRLARQWGLLDTAPRRVLPKPDLANAPIPLRSAAKGPAATVQDTIEMALRTAGLMR